MNREGRERQRRIKLVNIGLITSAIWLGASVAILFLNLNMRYMVLRNSTPGVFAHI